MPKPVTPSLAILILLLGLSACGGGTSSQRVVIQNKGSDTIVNVAQAFAEAYRQVNPNVAVAVSGGGTGTGIAALLNGTVDIANASRDITPEEREKIRQARGAEPLEHTIAIDAVVFFVHPQNPLQEITFEQLACIYGENGTCNDWPSVGVQVPGCADQAIIRVSRQSNSGTYEYVREHVLGKDHDFKLGSRDMQGSKDVVDLVTNTPCAIGYSGLGYATSGVKALCLAKAKGEPCTPPSVEAAKAKTYPMARPLYMYTLGDVRGPVHDYLEWIRSPAGQKIVTESGFIPHD
jgi:phosphate transport system substrate-binding protein